MENYDAAFKCRIDDISALLGATPPRGVAAVHLGGVAIECRIKALIISYHQITAWGGLSQRPSDPRTGQPILRTSHALAPALKIVDNLYKKALADKLFLKHLGNLTYPTGASAIDFIALRYTSNALSAKTLNEWQTSFKYVVGWLQKNEGLL
ncbi:hypothetical protein [Massilia sp. CCM 8734]|uniref:hypothetical protein n=1 Tax=Massilia sp. CCM 8734 TaxID=2609283 RepID=UPI00141F2F35|nr:hypothetical protein [Massilia sp. CCM 8734]NHZ99989.1 hypothetical protein [Massilia sp. CCM 8734]